MYCIRIRTRGGIYSQIYPQALSSGYLEGELIYLTVYPELSPYTDNILFLAFIRLMITSLISLTISPYTPCGVYCEIYPLLEGNTEELHFKIPLLRMI